MTNRTVSPDDIDALLPQTQCGLCEYPDCLSYAKAIYHDDETINRCLPGGVHTLQALATVTGQDASPYIEDLAKKTKPPMIAVIREHECIGCTKCIQACPTDAIIGAAKQMHTVITKACTGCELCIEPCPIDCIDMVPIPEKASAEQKQIAYQWRNRYNKRQKRLQKIKESSDKQHQSAKLNDNSQKPLAARKAAIRDAIARVKSKKARAMHESQ